LEAHFARNGGENVFRLLEQEEDKTGSNAFCQRAEWKESDIVWVPPVSFPASGMFGRIGPPWTSNVHELWIESCPLLHDLGFLNRIAKC
jgi:hypothetical protein